MPKIILASKSERRIALLNQVDIKFEVMPANIDENLSQPLSPTDTAQYIAEKKALHIANQIKDDSIIIAADTIVSIDNKILGKPDDATHATKMLQLLCGKRHEVYTGVSIMQNGKIQSNFVEKTNVCMRNYSDKEIDWYVNTGEPFDKAGSYGIQEKGCLLVDKIEGDFYTVMGLPITKVYLALQKLM